MKVFGCKNNGHAILVAADSIDDAYNTALSGGINCEYYPRELWKEYSRLSCDCGKYSVILEEDKEE